MPPVPVYGYASSKRKGFAFLSPTSTLLETDGRQLCSLCIAFNTVLVQDLGEHAQPNSQDQPTIENANQFWGAYEHF